METDKRWMPYSEYQVHRIVAEELELMLFRYGPNVPESTKKEVWTRMQERIDNLKLKSNEE